MNPKFKTKYRVTNWREYEAGLRARGDVQIWFSEEALAQWMAEPTGQRGAQRRYSDTAISTVLSLSLVFHLPLRQAEGFASSLLRLMGLDLDVPDHSTLSRRRKDLPLPKLRPRPGEPLHLIVDSTGLKIYGAGEWSSLKSKKRRGWRKLHIGVDGDGYIVAGVLTDGEADDATTAEPMIEGIDEPIRRFIGDGAFDRLSIYRVLDERGTEDVEVVIPPRADAVHSEQDPKTWDQRNAALDIINAIGRLGWQQLSGYRQQGRVENTFCRFKTILGPRLRSRLFDSQAFEALLGCEVLNRMLELGRPISIAIKA